jgi:hypothetical protein
MSDYPVSRAIGGVDEHGHVQDAQVHSRDGHPRVLALTEEFRILSQLPKAFFNPVNGINMAVDASFGGTPVPVATGGDAADWAFANILGATGADGNTDQARTPTRSVVWNRPAILDTIEFDQTTDITIASYAGISGYVYVDSGWSVDDEISMYCWDDDLAAIVGNAINLSDYIDTQDFGTFHKFSVPFDDLGLNDAPEAVFDIIRFTITASSGQKPLVYFDDIAVEETFGAIEYRIFKDSAKDYYVNGLTYTFVDAFDSRLDTSSMPNLSYNKILAQAALDNGLLFKRVQGGVTEFQVVLRSLIDFLRVGTRISEVAGDGTNTILVLEVDFPQPIVLRGSDESNYLSITCSDDLSVFLEFSVFARGSEKEN